MQFLFLGAALFLAPSTPAQSPDSSDAAIAKRIEASPTIHFGEQHIALHASIGGWEVGAVSGVAADNDGHLLVMQRGTKADPILVFDRRGNLLRSWGKGDFTLPHSLRIDPSGKIWALDAGASKVIKYSQTGEKLLTISVSPVPNTGSPFRGITDIAFAPGGNLYITDGYGNARVLEYTADGSKVREWGHAGTDPGEFHLPHAIQMGPDGTIYVADRENGRIEKFDRIGHFLGAIDHLGRCYALVLEHGALWASVSPMAKDPGSPGWLLKLDPVSGVILGHVDVPDEREGHALDLLPSGEPIITAGKGLLLFQRQ